MEDFRHVPIIQNMKLAFPHTADGKRCRQGAKSGYLADQMPYLRFGRGRRKLLIIPGISDSIRSLTSMPRYAVWLYHRYANDYTIYFVSRKQGLRLGTTTKEMAGDYAAAIDEIGGPVDVLSLSMGSLIAQHLAVDFSEKIEGLILSLGCSRGVPATIERARHWIDLAMHEKWNDLYIETVDMAFSGLRRFFFRQLTPLLLRRPKIPADFIISLQACILHDTRDRLAAITAPTLVVGGTQDRLIPEGFYRELADFIPSASLRLIDHGGHGLFEEKKREFESAVIHFLNSIQRPLALAYGLHRC